LTGGRQKIFCQKKNELLKARWVCAHFPPKIYHQRRFGTRQSFFHQSVEDFLLKFGLSGLFLLKYYWNPLAIKRVSR
jgi:hypothetical protein